MKVFQQYLLYSTVIGLFSSALVIHVGIGIQIFYLVMLLNLFIMLLLKRLWAPPVLLLLVAFLAFSGAVGILRGTDSLARFLKEILGIGISAFYSCSFFRTMEFDIERCFRVYARMAYRVSIIGIVLVPLRLHGDYRLHSVLTEPSMFVLTCIPALYFFLDQWQRHGLFRREALVMLLAFILADSSNGFLGILLGLVIFFMRYRRARLLLPAIVIATGILFYSLFDDFELRLDDSLKALQRVDLEGANLSTFALLSNLFVTEHVLQEHPLLGNGLGSHGMSYKKYIGDVQGAESFNDTPGENINAEDANSLALRVLSEMGLIGVLLLLWFIWKCRPKGRSDLAEMSKSIWIYLFIKLLRGGHYFSNEQYFFVVFYALASLNARHMLTLYGPILPGDRVLFAIEPR